MTHLVKCKMGNKNTLQEVVKIKQGDECTVLITLAPSECSSDGDYHYCHYEYCHYDYVTPQASGRAPGANGLLREVS